MRTECRHSPSPDIQQQCWSLAATPIVDGEVLEAATWGRRHGASQAEFSSGIHPETNLTIGQLGALAARMGGHDNTSAAHIRHMVTKDQWSEVYEGMRTLHANLLLEAVAKTITLDLVPITKRQGTINVTNDELLAFSLLATGVGDKQVRQALYMSQRQIDDLVKSLAEKTKSHTPEQTLLRLFEFGVFVVANAAADASDKTAGTAHEAILSQARSHKAKEMMHAVMDRLNGLTNEEVCDKYDIGMGSLQSLLGGALGGLRIPDLTTAAALFSGVRLPDWAPPQNLYLSPLEAAVVKSWAQGKSDVEITMHINKTFGTDIATDSSNRQLAGINQGILSKLGAKNRLHAVWLALRSIDD